MKWYDTAHYDIYFIRQRANKKQITFSKTQIAFGKGQIGLNNVDQAFISIAIKPCRVYQPSNYKTVACYKCILLWNQADQ